MSGYGSHITLTSSTKPSIFDVVSQDHLMSSLQPAVKHILKILAESCPEKYGWCYLYTDEIFCLLNGLIQYHYLRYYSASFAENFYDLKRVRLKQKSGITFGLAKKDVWKSCAQLVAYHYIHNKIQTSFNKLKEQDYINTQTLSGKLKYLFFRIWPHIHLIWEFSHLIFYIRYIIGHSKVHSPLLFLCGLRLVHLTEEDHGKIEERTESINSFVNIKSPRDFIKWFLENFGSTLMNSLEIGAFFLQFLDWFYSSNQTPANITSSNPTPKPPQKVIKDLSGVPKSHCPICLHERRNDTVCTVSGYVFCYSCILLFVREKNACPITGYPANTSQLIRIYNHSEL